MAEVLGQFPVSRFKSKYAYSEWFDGRVWKLAKGVDFFTERHVFVNNIYTEAKRRGFKVRIHKEGDNSIVIQARSDIQQIPEAK